MTGHGAGAAAQVMDQFKAPGTKINLSGPGAINRFSGPSARRRRPVPAHLRRENDPVPRIFVTGSTDGLGRAAAGVLISEGHDVILHARTGERAAAISDLAADAAGVVIGDLSSGLHHAGAGSLRDIDWTGRSWNAAQAYAESKLHVTALALTLARVWPDVLSNAVDPGWVPTKMGGPIATGNLQMGYLTQTWLAVSNDAAATVSGGYWYHRQRQAPAPQARDPAFQDQLMDRLTALTGVALF